MMRTTVVVCQMVGICAWIHWHEHKSSDGVLVRLSVPCLHLLTHLFVLLGTDNLLEPGAGHWYGVHLLGCVSLVCGSPARLCLLVQALCLVAARPWEQMPDASLACQAWNVASPCQQICADQACMLKVATLAPA
jgi:hypothetical protein